MKVYIDLDKFDDITRLVHNDEDYANFLIETYGSLEESVPFAKSVIKAFIKQKYKIIYNERWLPGLGLQKERSLYGTKNRITMFLLRL